MPRDIADRDCGERCVHDAQVPVGQYPVGEIQCIPLEPLGVRNRTDRLEHQVRCQFGAVVQQRPRDPILAAELGDGAPEMEADAALFMVTSHRRAQVLTQGADHRLGVEGNHVDVAFQRARSRRHLASDESRSQDQQPGTGAQVIAQGHGVVDRAKQEAPVGGSGNRQTPRTDTGRHHQPGHRQHLAIGQRDRAAGEVG